MRGGPWQHRGVPPSLPPPSLPALSLPPPERVLLPLPLPPGRAVLGALPALAAALAGEGPAWLPVPAGDTVEGAALLAAMAPGTAVDGAVAFVTATSGSTGVPKGAQLTAAALGASAAATHRRLGGPGAWLLALPTHHVAGLQVLLRGVAAGTEPVVVDVSRGFDPALLPAAVAALPGPRRYTSLVPTQLLKALEHPGATEALAAMDAVLVGGAALAPAARARAQAAGIRVVRTYGMSETCGGCVYDGVPLDGVRVRTDGGVVVLGGPVVAAGYRNAPGHPAFAEPGWFRTSDLGEVRAGVLRVLGRADEGISTGGVTVLPAVVEEALAKHPDVRECAVTGVPDPRLGQRVAAAVVPAAGAAPDPARLRAFVAEQLGPHAAPRQTLVVDALPLRGPGKVDYATLRGWFAAQ